MRSYRSRTVSVLIAAAVLAGPAFVTAATAAPAKPSSTIGAESAGDPYFPNLGNGGYDVQHYDIAFTYDPYKTQKPRSW